MNLFNLTARRRKGIVKDIDKINVLLPRDFLWKKRRERKRLNMRERGQKIPSNFRVTRPVKGSSRKLDREDTSVLTSVPFILTLQRGRNNFLKFMHPVVPSSFCFFTMQSRPRNIFTEAEIKRATREGAGGRKEKRKEEINREAGSERYKKEKRK